MCLIQIARWKISSRICASIYIPYVPNCLQFSLSVGLDAVISLTGLNCEEMDSLKWIASTDKLFDEDLHTCDTFPGNNHPSAYIWVYIGETLGPIHVDVIGNYTCWPQMELRVMRVTADGRIEHCFPRSKMGIQGIYFKAWENNVGII